MLKNDLFSALSDMEIMSQVFNIEPFEIYLLGGSGCVLAGYIQRATRDFDIIDLEYKSQLGRVLKLLEPYDMIDIQLAVIPESYKKRAIRLDNYKYLHIFVLSREDIIISKLGRYNERDADDIKIMLPDSDINVILNLSDEVLNNSDLYVKIKKAFIKNFISMTKECDIDVQNYVQQLEKLCRILQ